MTDQQAARLADIRSRTLFWSAVRDVSTWESPFLLELLDENIQRVAALERILRVYKSQTTPDKGFARP